jgi:DNA-binding response OmpR family regulator
MVAAGNRRGLRTGRHVTRQDPTILVIDDDAAMRTAIAGWLAADGYEVLAAKDGREGMDLFYLHRPALIICDILMPGRDGLETIGALRDARVMVPIIAMSEVFSDAVLLLETATMIGADAAILKPLSGDKLLETVALLLPAGNPCAPPAGG